MTEVVLYHHVQGLTEGVQSFADELRQAGHTVHTPDLFDGRTFDTIDEGMAFAGGAGFGALAERGVAAAQLINPEAVYAGFSFGVMVAQQLAQTRPGARGALLMYSCLPVSEFGDAWPEGVPVQVHGKDHDPFFPVIGDAYVFAAATFGAQLLRIEACLDAEDAAGSPLTLVAVTNRNPNGIAIRDQAKLSAAARCLARGHPVDPRGSSRTRGQRFGGHSATLAEATLLALFPWPDERRDATCSDQSLIGVSSVSTASRNASTRSVSNAAAAASYDASEESANRCSAPG
jgi:dienelactone hydrolase